ncbi:MAG TPA: hypothetical protein PLV92_23325, partial [Pirellulaceae bacterium]|nr:hypothetical protein [Pirellulaceae bacterium]
MNSHSTRRRRFAAEVLRIVARVTFAAAMLLATELRVDAESPTPAASKLSTTGAPRAAGIDGAVLIDSADSPRDATLDAFANDNRTPAASWVVITATPPAATSAVATAPNANVNVSPSANAAASGESVVARLARRFETTPGESFTVVRASDANDSAKKRTLAALATASHVWLDIGSSDTLSNWLADESFRSALSDVRRRGGLIAGARSLAKIASRRSLVADRPALNWIPDLGLSLAEAMAEADQQELGRWRDWLEANPGHVGLRLAADSAFLLRGRQLDL